MATAQAPSCPTLPEKGELTSAETAAAIGWSEGSLRVARCNPKSGMTPPPSFKRNNQVIYPKDELIQWMLERGAPRNRTVIADP